MAIITIHNEKALYKRGKRRILKGFGFFLAVFMVFMSFGGTIFGAGIKNTLGIGKNTRLLFGSASEEEDKNGQNVPVLQEKEAGPDKMEVANQLPSCDNITVSLKEGSIASGSLLASDPDGDLLTFSLFEKPKKGDVTLNDNGTYQYTPLKDVSGSDVLWFFVSDGKSSVKGKVTFLIEGSNDRPFLLVDKGYTLQVKKTFSLKLSGKDQDGDKLTFGAKNLPKGATYTPSTRIFRFTPSKAGVYSVTFWVKDKESTYTKTVTLTVKNR